MVLQHVVVDGSNIATEGKDAPSLSQLDDAVQAFVREFQPEIVTVVVDATFPNRIAREERRTYEEAVVAGEIVTPPAGAVGRGDAFVLQIADRSGATVLSNDSFQEFHGTYDWLFDDGRLIGGKPVAHVGWVFMGRAPVRGPASRRAVSAAKRAQAGGRPVSADGTKAAKATKPAKKAAKASKATKATDATKSTKAAKPARAAKPAKATKATKAAKEATKPAKKAAKVAKVTKSERKAKATKSPKATKAAPPGDAAKGAAPKDGSGGDVVYNEALPFIEFVGAHPVGSVVQAVVEEFSSHGAYVSVDGVRAYVPLRYLGEPPPRSAKAVLRLGESREFVVMEIDAARRGVDVALPGVVPTPAGPDPRSAAAKKGASNMAAALRRVLRRQLA